MASPESPYLAFIVGLHVATALALLVYFWRDWVRITGGFVSSLRALARLEAKRSPMRAAASGSAPVPSH